MHLIEAYALVTGCKIKQPYIATKEIKLPSKKYIVLHGYNPKGTDRQYMSWDKVIRMLQDNPKFDYEIVQIGGANNMDFGNINNSYLGKTTIQELAYLIKHAELIMCFDSFPMHIATVFDTKIVTVFGKYPQNSRPYFGTPENQIVLAPDFDNLPVKASLNGTSDPNNLINTIPPELVYESIVSLL